MTRTRICWSISASSAEGTGGVDSSGVRDRPAIRTLVSEGGPAQRRPPYRMVDPYGPDPDSRSILRDRQADRELRSLAGLALQVDSAAVDLHDPPGGGQ